MNLSEFLTQGLALVGAFDLKLIAVIFLLCFAGEAFGFFVPYLFEAFLLLAGYQFSQGVLPPQNLLFLVLTTIAGREAGTLVLCFLGKTCSPWLGRFKNRFKMPMNLSVRPPVKLLGKTLDFLTSPFSVAIGRLFWLRMPITLLLGAQGKMKALLTGVALSSLVYEGIFISLGAIFGSTVQVSPVTLVLYSLGALTAIYGITFIIRRLVSLLNKRRQLATVKQETE